jgi:hypothetical protein
MFMGRLSMYVLKIAAIIEISNLYEKYTKYNKRNKQHIQHKHNKQNTDDNRIHLESVLFVLFDKKTPLVIGLPSVLFALRLVNNLFFPAAIKISRLVKANENSGEMEKVYNYAVKYGLHGIRRGKLMGLTHLKMRDFDEAMNTLEETGRIRANVVTKEGGGRPVITYYPVIVSNEEAPAPVAPDLIDFVVLPESDIEELNKSNEILEAIEHEFAPNIEPKKEVKEKIIPKVLEKKRSYRDDLLDRLGRGEVIDKEKEFKSVQDEGLDRIGYDSVINELSTKGWITIDNSGIIRPGAGL